MDDHLLLREFAENRSRTAMHALVERYLPLVYSTALRHVHDPDAAKDVSQQAIFVLLRKARRFPPHTPLGPWLMRVARYIALDQVRTEARRHQRERRWAFSRPEQSSADVRLWEEIEPYLDKALYEIGEKYRVVVVMRYLEGHGVADIARQLGLTEPAVRQRISRALIKLRSRLLRRGVCADGAALGALLTASTGSNSSMPSAAAVARDLASLVPPSTAAPATPPLLGYPIAHFAMGILMFLLVGVGSLFVSWPAEHTPVVLNATAAKPPSTLSPLIWAVQRDDLEEVRRLLAEGADVNEVSRDGNDMPAMMYAAMKPSDRGLPFVKLLVANGADVNSRHGQWGYTAVMTAARNRSIQTVRFLSEMGADLHLRDRRGNTTIAMAAATGDAAHTSEVRALVGP